MDTKTQIEKAVDYEAKIAAGAEALTKAAADLAAKLKGGATATQVAQMASAIDIAAMFLASDVHALACIAGAYPDPVAEPTKMDPPPAPPTPAPEVEKAAGTPWAFDTKRPG